MHSRRRAVPGRRGASARPVHEPRQCLLCSGSPGTTSNTAVMLSLAPRRAARILLVHGRPSRCLPRSPLPLLLPSAGSPRTFLSWFKSQPKAASGANAKGSTTPLLSQDDLFHPFSASPIPAIRARGEAIRQLAPCPVCADEHEGMHAHTQAQPKAVAFECPDCGWPTHCSEEHWRADEEHERYCGRLREANEDEHDLRSGRRMREFELPGAPFFFADVLSNLCSRVHVHQVRRTQRQPSHSRIGTSFGTPGSSLLWTRRDRGGMPAKS